MAIELEEATEVKNEKVEKNTNGQKIMLDVGNSLAVDISDIVGEQKCDCDYSDNISEHDKKMGLLSPVDTRLQKSSHGISVLDLCVNNLEEGHYSGLEDEIVSCLDIIDNVTEPFVTFDDAFNKLTDQIHDYEIDDKALDQIKYAFSELASDPITVARKDPAVSVLHEKIKSINGVISNIEFLKDNINYNKNKEKQVIVKLSDVATSLGINTVVEDCVEIERSVDHILRKHGLITLDGGPYRDTDERCIVIGNINMEVDRVKLASVIDRLVGIVGYEESGEDRDYYMTPEVRKALNLAISELVSMHENWQEFL